MPSSRSSTTAWSARSRASTPDAHRLRLAGPVGVPEIGAFRPHPWSRAAAPVHDARERVGRSDQHRAGGPLVVARAPKDPGERMSELSEAPPVVVDPAQWLVRSVAGTTAAPPPPRAPAALPGPPPG